MILLTSMKTITSLPAVFFVSAPFFSTPMSRRATSKSSNSDVLFDNKATDFVLKSFLAFLGDTVRFGGDGVVGTRVGKGRGLAFTDGKEGGSGKLKNKQLYVIFLKQNDQIFFS